jgi:L-seryl-tRNA(Ser) seleniumtransferase
MTSPAHQSLLRRLPSISELLASPTATAWQSDHPAELVTDCLRAAVDDLRADILADRGGQCGPAHITPGALLDRAADYLAARTRPNIRPAINATGIILHTALGRAVWPASIVDDMVPGLKGYVTLAIDRESGTRSERDNRVEAILCELTDAEAATVVNNNAGATLLALAALCGGGEVIVSRGQLIEIGGSFRLPDVMAASGATMIEVGTTNRTHLRDYANACTEQTAAIFRAHPSNYRVVGFAGTPRLDELVALGREKHLPVIDDLGAGALIGLERFNLPHEPTMGESIAAGADVVLASGDKLIGASQAGVLVGRAEAIHAIRRHPLARALRPDKTCLMALERTLMLFRDPDRLVREHPTYRMLAESVGTLTTRAERLAEAIGTPAGATCEIIDSAAYLGSGSLPTEALPSRAVAIKPTAIKPDELARRLRLHDACLFTRIDAGCVLLDVRTITDREIPTIAAALAETLAQHR